MATGGGADITVGGSVGGAMLAFSGGGAASVSGAVVIGRTASVGTGEIGAAAWTCFSAHPFSRGTSPHVSRATAI